MISITASLVEVQEVITFSVVPNFLVKKPLILSGFEAVVVLYTVFWNHQTCLVWKILNKMIVMRYVALAGA